MFTFFGTSIVILILTVFMLTEARMFGRRFKAICDARGPNFQRMLSATRDIQRYLGIKTLVSLGTGVLAGLLCWAAGLDFFLLWGIVAFALNFIPVVGSVIAGVPPMLLAMLVSGLPSGIAVAGGYILINMLLGNFVEPMLMGRRFGLSTLVVVLSVLFWGWLWGPIGMLLAVPLTMMLKVVLDNSEEFRWIAVAISKEQRRPAEEQRIIRSGVGIETGDDGGEAAGVGLGRCVTFSSFLAGGFRALSRGMSGSMASATGHRGTGLGDGADLRRRDRAGDRCRAGLPGLADLLGLPDPAVEKGAGRSVADRFREVPGARPSDWDATRSRSRRSGSSTASTRCTPGPSS